MDSKTRDDRHSGSRNCYPSLPFEVGMLLRPVIQQIEDEAVGEFDNATTMAMRELKQLRVLLCWAYRQREGHINVAPPHYDNAQASAWVSGWDAAFNRFWELFEDTGKLVESVPDEDTRFDG